MRLCAVGATESCGRIKVVYLVVVHFLLAIQYMQETGGL